VQRFLARRRISRKNILNPQDFAERSAGTSSSNCRSEPFVGQYLVYPTQKIENGIFTFWLEIPLALGTVGGLTTLHPLVKLSLKCLKTFRQRIDGVVAAGLAQNFAALRSLTTTGIQDGHMKMHLNNILNQFEANDDERILIRKHFKHNTVSQRRC
jgi:hydroxymethylglutaryl-CoA reductase